MWMRQGANWLVQRFAAKQEEEEHFMGGASSGEEYRNWFVEGEWEVELDWEDGLEWDSLEGRRVELGLS
jgi:hypothetical protein